MPYFARPTPTPRAVLEEWASFTAVELDFFHAEVRTASTETTMAHQVDKVYEQEFNRFCSEFFQDMLPNPPFDRV
jgi:hypothetical protein